MVKPEQNNYSKPAFTTSAFSAAPHGKMVFISLTPPTPLCKGERKTSRPVGVRLSGFFPPDSHRSAWENAFGDFAKIQMPNGRGNPIRPSPVLSPTWQRGVGGLGGLTYYSNLKIDLSIPVWEPIISRSRGGGLRNL